VLCFLHDVNEGSFDFKRFNIRRKAVSPGAPPAPVRLPGQNFFEEKFSPFQWTLSVDWTGGDNGTTERMKIFPQKNFAWKSDWAGGAPGDKLIFSLYDKLVITQKLSNSQVICCKEAQLSLSSYYSQRNLVRVLVLN